MTGAIEEVNKDLEDSLETIAESPYEDGWMVKIKPSDPGEYEELLSAEDYQQKLEEED